MAGPAIWWPDGLKTLMPAPAGETGSLKTNSTTGGSVDMIASGGGPDWISWAWAKAIWAIARRRDRLRSRGEPRPLRALPAPRPERQGAGARFEARVPRRSGREGPSS